MIGHDPISWVAAARHFDNFDPSEIATVNPLPDRTTQAVPVCPHANSDRFCGSDCAQRETGGASAMNSRQ